MDNINQIEPEENKQQQEEQANQEQNNNLPNIQIDFEQEEFINQIMQNFHDHHSESSNNDNENQNNQELEDVFLINQVQVNQQLQNQQRLNQIQNLDLIDNINDNIHEEEDESSPISIADEHENSESDEDYISNTKLIFKSVTWNRDSHGLFDYETRHPHKKQMQMTVEKKVFRIGQDIQLVDLDADIKENFGEQAQYLFTVRKHNNKYQLETPKYEKNEDLNPQPNSDQENQIENQPNILPCDTVDRMFLVVRSIKKNNVRLGYQLKKHDIIKMGKVKYKVKDINMDQVRKYKELKNKYFQQKIELLNQMDNITDTKKKELDYYQKNYVVEQGSNFEVLEGELNYQEINGIFINEPKIDYTKQVIKKKSKHPLITEFEQEEEKKIDTQHIHDNQRIKQMDQSLRKGTIGNVELIQQNITYQDQIMEDFIQVQSQRDLEEETFRVNQQPNIDQQYQENIFISEESKQEQVESNQQTIKHSIQDNLIICPNREPERSQRNIRYNIFDVDEEEDNQSNKSKDLIDNQEEQKIEESHKQDDNQTNINIKDEQNDEDEQINFKELSQCRFCWDSDTSIVNPLLSSCKCKGGVQYIHYSCLKNWLNMKRNIKSNNNIHTYCWKNFECEICKTPYPYQFKVDNYKYPLVDISNIHGDYIVLESLSLDKNVQRLVHIINPVQQKKQFQIGRGNDADLRINDISVSRNHAMIQFQNDKFQIQDNNSKFGTLILVRKSLSLQPKQYQAIQVGRTLFNFYIKKTKPVEFNGGEFLYKNQNPTLQQQKEKLKKLYINMRNAQEYIVKQQQEHMRLGADPQQRSNNLFRRMNQDILDEELKIDHSEDEENYYQEEMKLQAENKFEIENQQNNNQNQNNDQPVVQRIFIPYQPFDILENEEYWVIPDEEVKEQQIQNFFQ